MRTFCRTLPTLPLLWATLAILSIVEGAGIVPAWASPASRLGTEIGSRLSRTPEFEFIRETARKLGVRAWLFGGTAASYAHYVKSDLVREGGDSRLQAERFDYDYTSIYRSTQDLDVAIDGTAAQAEAFERALFERYPHFLGSRAQWEVRCLRAPRGEKVPLLGDANFELQHTDSNSIGLVELTDPPVGEPRVRDLRHWQSRGSEGFLDDVTRGEIHFHYSGRHHETERFRQGLNPSIFSAVRFLTKAFQYGLAITPEDRRIVQGIVDGFDPARDLANPRANAWLQKNGKKLFQHAVDLEYAWNTLESLGLRRKLMEIGGQSGQPDSLAWWMNRQPLREHPVGALVANDPRHRLMKDLKPWKTAAELGIDVVAHETRTFEAYESITRSPVGHPNVFISRDASAGEAAAYGDSFYTRRGRRGAVGTGLTIRFRVDPNAREGVDFTRALEGDYVMFLNKRVLTVIPESLQLGTIEFLRFLRDSQIDHADRALLEKFERKIQNRLRAVDAREKDLIHEFFVTELARPGRSVIALKRAMDFIPEKVTLEDQIGLLADRDGLNIFGKWSAERLSGHRFSGTELEWTWLGRLAEASDFGATTEDTRIITRVVFNSLRENSRLRDISRQGPVLRALAKGMFSDDYGLVLQKLASRPEWVDSPESAAILHTLIERFSVEVLDLLESPLWQAHPEFLPLVRAIVKKSPEHFFLKIKGERGFRSPWSRVLLQDQTLRDELISKVADFVVGGSMTIDQMLEIGDEPKRFVSGLIEADRNYQSETSQKFDHILASQLLTRPDWAGSPEGVSLMIRLINKRRGYNRQVLSIRTGIVKDVLGAEPWISHPRLPEIVRAFIAADGYVLPLSDRPYALSVLSNHVLSNPKWAELPESREIALEIIRGGPERNPLIGHFGFHSEWVTGPFGGQLLREMQAYDRTVLEQIRSHYSALVVGDLFSSDSRWAIHPEASELIAKYVSDLADPKLDSRRYFLEQIVFRILLRDEGWARAANAGLILDAMLKHSDANFLLAQKLLTRPEWYGRSDSADFLIKLIRARRADGDIAWHVLPIEHWARHPRSAELMEEMIRLGTVDGDLDRLLRENPIWRENPRLREACGGRDPTVGALREAFRAGRTFAIPGASRCLAQGLTAAVRP